MVYHTGSMNFGHYTAKCFNHKKNKWYEYNDSSVTEIENLKELVNTNAYLLFYRRKDFNVYTNKELEA